MELLEEKQQQESEWQCLDLGSSFIFMSSAVSGNKIYTFRDAHVSLAAASVSPIKVSLFFRLLSRAAPFTTEAGSLLRRGTLSGVSLSILSLGTD